MNRAARASGASVVAFALALVMVACGPGETEPEAIEPPAPAPSPTEEPTPEPPAEIALPADCAEVFSPAFIAEMEGYHLPLNDPGISMPSTDLPSAVAVLDTEPSLRCTWGLPSEVGISTTIALVTPAQQDAIVADAEEGGFVCEDRAHDEVRCVFAVYEEETEMGSFSYGAEHAFRGNSWVATQWLNVEIPEYTDDIVTALWD